MGLLDDASNLLDRKAKEEQERQAAADARYQPWSADWTVELAGLLAQRGIPIHPVYVNGSRSKPVGAAAVQRSTYWGEAWPLQGWKQRSEWEPQPVQVLLDASGSLWESYPSGAYFPTFAQDGTTEDQGRHRVTLPDVSAIHRGRFMVVQARPQTVPHYPAASEALRDEVGVSVAAALRASQISGTGWIIGLKP